MARAVGIDLGTTNSVVAVLEGGEPTVIANSEGSRTTPSVVAFASNGEVLVGQSAKNQAVTNVDRTIRSVKRHMGSDWTTPEIDGKRYTAQEISAARAAEAQAGRRVVPGRGDHRRGDHRTRVLRGRPAPGHQGGRRRSRASTCCGSSTSPPRPRWPTGWTRARRSRRSWSSTSAAARSTCPCSRSARASSRSRRPTATTTSAATTGTSGSSPGSSTSSSSSTGIDLTKDKMAMQRLREAAEKAKIELSSQTTATINLPYITVDADKNPLFLDETLSRAEFQRITSDLLDRTRAPFNQVIKDADISVARHRPRRARRRLDPHAGRDRAGQGAHRRQGAEQGRQPGRGRRRRRRAAGRCAQGRGQGRPAARRHPAVAGHRDQGRGDYQAHRAQHHDPDQALGDLHDGRRQPAVGADPGVPGRAGDRGVQQEARHVRADRPAAGAAWRAADRGHLRHRRQRHRATSPPRTWAPARARP